MYSSISLSVKRIILFIGVACIVIVADQLSKLWISSNLSLGQSLRGTGFFHLTYGQNTGAVFGVFQGHNEIVTILVILEASIILFCYFFFRARYSFLYTRTNVVSLGLIFGGLLGNLIDRIRLGYVTDFIGIGPWPEFNIADASGVVGVIVLAFSIIVISLNKN